MSQIKPKGSSNAAINLQRNVPRRSFLRGAGAVMALPFLEAMTPAFARETESKAPRRILAICNNIGFLPEKFFPTGSGSDYKPSPYLELLNEHKQDFTVFSGVSHPGVDGSHASDVCFLTAAPHPASGGFRNTVSLDQYIADRIGNQTRFPSLTLGVNIKGQRSLSFTGTGAPIPCEEKASNVFKRMFVQGSEIEVQAQLQRLKTGQSIMDAVADQVQGLQKRVSQHDKDRLDQYFSSVRDLEKRLNDADEWERKPKPLTDAEPPQDPESPSDYMDKVRLMYDMAQLAFETDSTRLITLMIDSAHTPVLNLDGIEIMDDYHNLSHHGKSDKKKAQLERIDQEHMKLFSQLLSNLGTQKEQDHRLLDQTMVLFGSNFGDANTHETTNMPMILAGGGFKHGQHLAFDTGHNYPLPNLYVSMMQRIGLETDSFASSTGTMSGLEFA